ncbi:hypothetical protein PsW64_04032 [Pseudovibrio sp. W64]|uniref:hypothetical protein n=1 Tax=Pseudovibrio sp. W64 TaxID=1735583 RepID=UPI0007AE44E5|nr:hypothetical protein [Pseudovibrio sp. W64]KZK78393.1 hypothetical protein PsW64_04032 [Pseudovibrio sp. W64]
MHFAFHIGAHKTATTSFQRSLRASSRELKEAGVSVIGKRSKKNGQELYYSKTAPLLKRAYSGNEIRLLGKAAASAIQAVCNEDKTNTIFLSDEAILGDMPGQMIGFYPHCHNILEAILDELKPKSISISLVTRRQDTFLWSCYKQMYQLGRPLLLEEFLERARPKDADWHDLSKRIQKVAGRKLSVTPYEKIKTRGGTKFFQDILEKSLPGTKLPNLANVGNSNVSLDLTTMLDAMAMRANGSTMKQIQNTVLASRGKDSSKMPKILASAIMKTHHDSNMRLFADFIPEHSSKEFGYTSEEKDGPSIPKLIGKAFDNLRQN